MWKSKKLQLYLGLFICFCVSLVLSKNANAYVQIVYSQDGGTVYEMNAGEVGGLKEATTNLNLASAILSSNTKFTSSSNWILYPNWYAGMGNVSGNYLSVNADYYVGISFANSYGNYINTARNLMTQNNLRCVAGDSLNNYDGTYPAQISNYQITYQGPYTTGSTSSEYWRIHIQFNYIQQLSSNKTGGNVKCGWNRNPSNGLLFQSINAIPQAPTTFAYQNNGTTARLYSDYTQALLQQQISNQETIINNTTEINQNIENINDTLTDSNVSGNFDTAPIQPFGPIGTITNSILDLPKIILNISPCQPLTPELPYINENMEIPCPSTFLNQMAGNFMTFLDTIASAGIWFLMGRYIFRKVQKLRDPNTTDEEYLDI